MKNSLIQPPYKSSAAALIFVIILGPLGVFYTTVIGGVVMTAFGLVGIGTVVSMHSPLPMAAIWLISLLWAMAAVHRYNNRLFKLTMKSADSG